MPVENPQWNENQINTIKSNEGSESLLCLQMKAAALLCDSQRLTACNPGDRDKLG